MIQSLPLGPLVLDIAGTALSEDDRKLLSSPSVGGVILFERNSRTVKQVRELCADIRALRAPALIITIDHEGGRVQRFKDQMTDLPAMRSLGVEYNQDASGATRAAREYGRTMAADLRSLGIDSGFAPCADIDHGCSAVIGDRAFHSNPEAVAVLTAAFSSGLLESGVPAIAKHFPGHGSAEADSHVELTVDARPVSEIEKDLLPFDILVRKNLVRGIMASHIVYPLVDERPASLSPHWLQKRLREQSGFSGAIISDDLSMKAIRQFGSVERCAQMAIDAGCDIVIICHDREAAENTARGIERCNEPCSQSRRGLLHSWMPR